MNSLTSKAALLSALSAGAIVSLAAYSASAQTPWDVHRQQYQLTTGAGGAANQGGNLAGAQSQTNRMQTQTTLQTGPAGQSGAAGQIGAAGTSGQTQMQNRVTQTEISTTGQQGAGSTVTAGTGGNMFQFTNQDATGPAPQGAEGITRFLQQGVSVETATVPQLASAIAQYAATNSETVIGAIASLAAAYPDQAVKIAEAARLALPDRALEVAMAVAAVVPGSAIQIVVALAAADPSLAPTLAGLILPAAGGVNQTAAIGRGAVPLQEIPVRVGSNITPPQPPTTPPSPTGGG